MASLPPARSPTGFRGPGGDAEVFTTFLAWTADILSARGVRAATLLPALDLLGRELKDFPRATGLLDVARAELRSAGV